MDGNLEALVTARRWVGEAGDGAAIGRQRSISLRTTLIPQPLEPEDMRLLSSSEIPRDEAYTIRMQEPIYTTSALHCIIW